MFSKLKEINSRPEPFQFYTAEELWTNEYTAQKMLEYHLMEDVDVSSRNIKFIERSVRWIIEHFQVNTSTRIADFGCGPGLYSNRLAAAGAEVTGIDFSANSIKFARKTALERDLDVNFLVKNYLEFETSDKFDLIIMIMCDFCVLSPQQRKLLLQKFRSILKPEGAILLDVYSQNAFDQKEESATYEFNQLNGFWSPEDYYGFANCFKYEKEKVSLDKYTIVEENKVRVIYNWMQYFTQETLSQEFERNGFQITNYFSNVGGEPYEKDSSEFAVIARKSRDWASVRL